MKNGLRHLSELKRKEKENWLKKNLIFRNLTRKSSLPVMEILEIQSGELSNFADFKQRFWTTTANVLICSEKWDFTFITVMQRISICFGLQKPMKRIFWWQQLTRRKSIEDLLKLQKNIFRI